MHCGAETASDTRDVRVALERLAERRKHRQYSALNLSSDVVSSASATQCSTADVTDPNAKQKRAQSAQVWSRQRPPTDRRWKETNPECEDSADPKRDPHRTRRSSAAGRREITEDWEDSENPKRVRRRSSHSSAVGPRGLDQPDDVSGPAADTSGMNYYDNQRTMIEQSRALLEQSKAKHHALVAQAHSMQKRLRSHQISDPPVDRSDSQTTLAPRPPSAPPADRKPTSVFRTQRRTRYVDCY